jgi:signal transduction histidine kinase/ActR/RegA family two-component response regulator
MSTAFRMGAAPRDSSFFILRRVLPLMVAITVVTGLLRFFATDAGLVSEAVGVAVMTLFAIVTFAALAFWTARELQEAAVTQRDSDRDQLYRRVANNMSDGAVFLFDGDLRYILAEGKNFEEVDLVSSELEGRTIWEALDPDTAAAVEPSYRAALAGESSVFELDFRDNRYLVTVSPTYEDGKIDGGLVHTQQITQRKRLEEQLHQSQKLEAVGALAGGVAHDFNNLLTVISGYSSLALRTLPSGDPARFGIEQVSIAAKRAASLTYQLLAFSRRQFLQPKALDVTEVVEGIVPMLEMLIEERIELVLDLAPDLPPVMFDAGRLEQVIVNLAVNARDAIDDAGTITIETSEVTLDPTYASTHADARIGPHVALVISDTGAGIDDQTRARIFEPFFTTKEAGRGSGLGLSTVHGIVTQSGGNIWVYSELGRGTTFKIYLPVALDEASNVAASAPAAPAAFEGGTILVVEDHDAVRALTVRVLREAGYRTLEAASVDDAIELLDRTAVDVILTDLVMPGGTGERLAGHEDERGLTPSLVYMSGYTEATISRDDLLAAGAGFLEKPFTPGRLLAVIAAARAAGPHRPVRSGLTAS